MKTPRILIALFSALIFVSSVVAATPEETAKKTLLTVNLKDASVPNALKFIETMSGVKVFYTPPAGDKTTVTLNLKNVSAYQVIKYVAGLANLNLSYKNDGAHLSAKK